MSGTCLIASSSVLLFWHTIFFAKNQGKYPPQPKQIQEIPRQRGNPSHVHVGGFDAALEHGFEAECEGEGEFDWQGREVVVSAREKMRKQRQAKREER